MRSKKLLFLVLFILANVKYYVSSVSDSPMLIKILEVVDRSDEHLFDVTLQLLKSLCACMRETLKKKEEQLHFNEVSHSPTITGEQHYSEKVVDLYRKIYDNTCFDLWNELTSQFHKGDQAEDNDTNGKNGCAKHEQNYINYTLAKYNHGNTSDLERVMYETLIETKDLRYYTIKENNLFRNPKVLNINTLKQSVIFIFTLPAKINDAQIEKPQQLPIKDKTTYATRGRVDIDIYYTIFYDYKLEGDTKLYNLTQCNLYSLYSYLKDKNNHNQINNYKVMNKKDKIKIYIDVADNKTRNVFLNICCNNNTDICEKDLNKIFSTTKDSAEHQQHHFMQGYKGTISKIKDLVKQYDERIEERDRYSSYINNSENITFSGQNETANETNTKEYHDIPKPNTIQSHIYLATNKHSASSRKSDHTFENQRFNATAKNTTAAYCNSDNMNCTNSAKEIHNYNLKEKVTENLVNDNVIHNYRRTISKINNFVNQLNGKISGTLRNHINNLQNVTHISLTDRATETSSTNYNGLQLFQTIIQDQNQITEVHNTNNKLSSNKTEQTLKVHVLGNTEITPKIDSIRRKSKNEKSPVISRDLQLRDFASQSQMKDTNNNDISTLDSLEENSWIEKLQNSNGITRDRKAMLRKIKYNTNLILNKSKEKTKNKHTNNVLFPFKIFRQNLNDKINSSVSDSKIINMPVCLKCYTTPITKKQNKANLVLEYPVTVIETYIKNNQNELLDRKVNGLVSSKILVGELIEEVPFKLHSQTADKTASNRSKVNETSLDTIVSEKWSSVSIDYTELPIMLNNPQISYNLSSEMDILDKPKNNKLTNSIKILPHKILKKYIPFKPLPPQTIYTATTAKKKSKFGLGNEINIRKHNLVLDQTKNYVTTPFIKPKTLLSYETSHVLKQKMNSQSSMNNVTKDPLSITTMKTTISNEKYIPPDSRDTENITASLTKEMTSVITEMTLPLLVDTLSTAKLKTAEIGPILITDTKQSMPIKSKVTESNKYNMQTMPIIMSKITFVPPVLVKPVITIIEPHDIINISATPISKGTTEEISRLLQLKSPTTLLSILTKNGTELSISGITKYMTYTSMENTTFTNLNQISLNNELTNSDSNLILMSTYKKYTKKPNVTNLYLTSPGTDSIQSHLPTRSENTLTKSVSELSSTKTSEKIIKSLFSSIATTPLISKENSTTIRDVTIFSLKPALKFNQTIPNIQSRNSQLEDSYSGDTYSPLLEDLVNQKGRSARTLPILKNLNVIKKSYRHFETENPIESITNPIMITYYNHDNSDRNNNNIITATRPQIENARNAVTISNMSVDVNMSWHSPSLKSNSSAYKQITNVLASQRTEKPSKDTSMSFLLIPSLIKSQYLKVAQSPMTEILISTTTESSTSSMRNSVAKHLKKLNSNNILGNNAIRFKDTTRKVNEGPVSIFLNRFVNITNLTSSSTSPNTANTLRSILANRTQKSAQSTSSYVTLPMTREPPGFVVNTTKNHINVRTGFMTDKSKLASVNTITRKPVDYFAKLADKLARSNTKQFAKSSTRHIPNYSHNFKEMRIYQNHLNSVISDMPRFFDIYLVDTSPSSTTSYYENVSSLKETGTAGPEIEKPPPLMATSLDDLASLKMSTAETLFMSTSTNFIENLLNSTTSNYNNYMFHSKNIQNLENKLNSKSFRMSHTNSLPTLTANKFQTSATSITEPLLSSTNVETTENLLKRRTGNKETLYSTKNHLPRDLFSPVATTSIKEVNANLLSTPGTNTFSTKYVKMKKLLNTTEISKELPEIKITQESKHLQELVKEPATGETVLKILNTELRTNSSTKGAKEKKTGTTKLFSRLQSTHRQGKLSNSATTRGSENISSSKIDHIIKVALTKGVGSNYDHSSTIYTHLRERRYSTLGSDNYKSTQETFVTYKPLALTINQTTENFLSTNTNQKPEKQDQFSTFLKIDKLSSKPKIIGLGRKTVNLHNINSRTHSVIDNLPIQIINTTEAPQNLVGVSSSTFQVTEKVQNSIIRYTTNYRQNMTKPFMMDTRSSLKLTKVTDRYSSKFPTLLTEKLSSAVQKPILPAIKTVTVEKSLISPNTQVTEMLASASTVQKPDKTNTSPTVKITKQLINSSTTETFRKKPTSLTSTTEKFKALSHKSHTISFTNTRDRTSIQIPVPDNLMTKEQQNLSTTQVRDKLLTSVTDRVTDIVPSLSTILLPNTLSLTLRTFLTKKMPAPLSPNTTKKDLRFLKTRIIKTLPTSSTSRLTENHHSVPTTRRTEIFLPNSSIVTVTNNQSLSLATQMIERLATSLTAPMTEILPVLSPNQFTDNFSPSSTMSIRRTLPLFTETTLSENLLSFPNISMTVKLPVVPKRLLAEKIPAVTALIAQKDQILSSTITGDEEKLLASSITPQPLYKILETNKMPTDYLVEKKPEPGGEMTEQSTLSIKPKTLSSAIRISVRDQPQVSPTTLLINNLPDLLITPVTEFTTAITEQLNTVSKTSFTNKLQALPKTLLTKKLPILAFTSSTQNILATSSTLFSQNVQNISTHRVTEHLSTISIGSLTDKLANTRTISMSRKQPTSTEPMSTVVSAEKVPSLSKTQSSKLGTLITAVWANQLQTSPLDTGQALPKSALEKKLLHPSTTPLTKTVKAQSITPHNFLTTPIDRMARLSKKHLSTLLKARNKVLATTLMLEVPTVTTSHLPATPIDRLAKLPTKHVSTLLQATKKVPAATLILEVPTVTTSQLPATPIDRLAKLSKKHLSTLLKATKKVPAATLILEVPTVTTSLLTEKLFNLQTTRITEALSIDELASTPLIYAQEKYKSKISKDSISPTPKYISDTRAKNTVLEAQILFTTNNEKTEQIKSKTVNDVNGEKISRTSQMKNTSKTKNHNPSAINITQATISYIYKSNPMSKITETNTVEHTTTSSLDVLTIQNKNINRNTEYTNVSNISQFLKERRENNNSGSKVTSLYIYNIDSVKSNIASSDVSLLKNTMETKNIQMKKAAQNTSQGAKKYNSAKNNGNWTDFNKISMYATVRTVTLTSHVNNITTTVQQSDYEVLPYYTLTKTKHASRHKHKDKKSKNSSGRNKNHMNISTTLLSPVRVTEKTVKYNTYQPTEYGELDFFTRFRNKFGYFNPVYKILRHHKKHIKDKTTLLDNIYSTRATFITRATVNEKTDHTKYIYIKNQTVEYKPTVNEQVEYKYTTIPHKYKPKIKQPAKYTMKTRQKTKYIPVTKQTILYVPKIAHQQQYLIDLITLEKTQNAKNANNNLINNNKESQPKPKSRIVTKNYRNFKNKNSHLRNETFNKTQMYPLKRLVPKRQRKVLKEIETSKRIENASNAQKYFVSNRGSKPKAKSYWAPVRIHNTVTSSPKQNKFGTKLEPLEEVKTRPFYFRPKPLIIENLNDEEFYYKTYFKEHRPPHLTLQEKAKFLQETLHNKLTTPLEEEYGVIEKPTTYVTPEEKPKFFKDRSDSMRNYIFDYTKTSTKYDSWKDDFIEQSNEDSDDHELVLEPSLFYYKRKSFQEVTTIKARTKRKRRTIFFLSPTVPYNRYF